MNTQENVSNVSEMDMKQIALDLIIFRYVTIENFNKIGNDKKSELFGNLEHCMHSIIKVCAQCDFNEDFIYKLESIKYNNLEYFNHIDSISINDVDNMITEIEDHVKSEIITLYKRLYNIDYTF